MSWVVWGVHQVHRVWLEAVERCWCLLGSKLENGMQRMEAEGERELLCATEAAVSARGREAC